MKKEEGVYTIKRVEKLPKKGNANYMYLLKGDVEKLYRWDQYYYEEINITEASEGPKLTTNIQSFVVDFDFGEDTYAGTVDIYQDGELVETIETDGQSVDLDLNKSTIFVGSTGGAMAVVIYENGERLDANIWPAMSNDGWYNSLEDVSVNEYGTIYIVAAV